jgi:hypothetical protein
VVRRVSHPGAAPSGAGGGGHLGRALVGGPDLLCRLLARRAGREVPRAGVGRGHAPAGAGPVAAGRRPARSPTVAGADRGAQASARSLQPTGRERGGPGDEQSGAARAAVGRAPHRPTGLVESAGEGQARRWLGR